MKKIKLTIIVASLYLLAYQILPFANVKPIIIAIMFGFAPFVVVWLVISILKKGEYNGDELSGEFGYEDYDPSLEK